LGYDLCETTVAKYIVRQPGPPSQTWRTFIQNHMAEIVAIDFFTVHTAAFKTLYVFLVLSLDRVLAAEAETPVLDSNLSIYCTVCA
jgi:putative transposase